jgi:hypothetical protein
MPQRRLRVWSKGGDTLWVPIGRKRAAASDRYLGTGLKPQVASGSL